MEEIKYIKGESVNNKTRIILDLKNKQFLLLAKMCFRFLKEKGNSYFAFTNKKEMTKFEKIVKKEFVKREENYYFMSL